MAVVSKNTTESLLACLLVGKHSLNAVEGWGLLLHGIKICKKPVRVQRGRNAKWACGWGREAKWCKGAASLRKTETLLGWLTTVNASASLAKSYHVTLSPFRANTPRCTCSVPLTFITPTLHADATTVLALSEARQNISKPWPYLQETEDERSDSSQQGHWARGRTDGIWRADGLMAGGQQKRALPVWHEASSCTQ